MTYPVSLDGMTLFEAPTRQTVREVVAELRGAKALDYGVLSSQAVDALRSIELRQAQIERDAAIAQVEAHSPPEWRVEAWDFLTEYLRTHRELHVDSLWDSGMPTPPERRALGPLMQRAAREKLMTPSGRFLPSVHSHLSPKPVWLSTIFEGAK